MTLFSPASASPTSRLVGEGEINHFYIGTIRVVQILRVTRTKVTDGETFTRYRIFQKNVLIVLLNILMQQDRRCGLQEICIVGSIAYT